ncbi:hypothetical protein K1719_035709 [Acacia pycnantha]|nr:hypothetical protein K1719_035704 [Acacia pycnantha]KAI9082286.1 hypothetical protein K1719_035709 [Acacia pycnantha]
MVAVDKPLVNLINTNSNYRGNPIVQHHPRGFIQVRSKPYSEALFNNILKPEDPLKENFVPLQLASLPVHSTIEEGKRLL